MASLRKNVASQHVGFCLNSIAAGTPVTAGGAGTVSKDGGAQAACAGTFTHLGTGQWDYAPTQAETNATNVSFAFTGTGAIQIGMTIYTDNWDTTAAVLTSGSGAAQIAVNGSGAVSTVAAVTGLTASNLDATISSRMATYTQPTGFLAATFPTGTVANTTNITAGTITTTTNLTNAPTAGDFTAAMKTSLNASTPASIQGSVASVLTGGLIDLTTTTFAEPTAVPAATATLKDKIGWLQALARNKITQTATTETLFRDDGTTTTSTSIDSDDGTTFTRNKWS